MTEEEKKAIEISKISLCVAHKYDRRNMIYNTASLETLLDLLEKQQRIMKSQEKIIMEQEKEIDKYKKQEFENLFNGRYVSKDKIRDKIKELEKYQKQHKEGNWADIPIEDYDFDKINLLKELLEEN